MANHILDKVTGQLFDELVDKVLAEDDVPLAVVTPKPSSHRPHLHW